MDALNRWFNAFVDISSVAFARLGELPVLLLLAGLGAGFSAAFAAWHLASRRRGRRGPSWKQYLRALAVTLAAVLVALAAQRLDALTRKTRALEYGLEYLANMEAVHRHRAERDALEGATGRRLIEPAELERGLGELFPSHALETEILEEGIELGALRTFGPSPTVSYLAVIDLTAPSVRIEITDELGTKRLTTDFGAERDCAVAINGEAGESPARDAPLGSYQGQCVSRGRPVLEVASRARPLLCFDRDNRARYVRAGAAAPAPELMYNTIWGRKDLLRDGAFASDTGTSWTGPNPRTLMGIDAAGERLVLMVVDGRQPGYSAGLSLEACADVMRLFGARDAMWCDQGGSTAMYLGCLAGLVNRPSDGRERPTYTHFGVGR